jgi:hypothetical protein
LETFFEDYVLLLLLFGQTFFFNFCAEKHCFSRLNAIIGKNRMGIF